MVFPFFPQLLVQAVSLIFPEFDFSWLVEEMKKNLPKELNFTMEAQNAERVAAQFTHLPWLKVCVLSVLA